MTRCTFGIALGFALVSGACSQDAPATVDAPEADAGPDAPDAGCGINYTGEYVDWDSTDATFLGINAATFTVRDQPTRTASTAPNGRFVMCIPDGNFSVVDITPPADYLPGIAFAKRDVLTAGAVTSTRSMTVARRDAMFGQIGAAYDPGAAQVLVHFNGVTAHRATIDASHTTAAVQAYNPDGVGGFAWTATDTGTYVFFPNVSLGATANAIISSDAAGTIGTAAIPLAPGTISYVELFVP